MCVRGRGGEDVYVCVTYGGAGTFLLILPWRLSVWLVTLRVLLSSVCSGTRACGRHLLVQQPVLMTAKVVHLRAF